MRIVCSSPLDPVLGALLTGHPEFDPSGPAVPDLGVQWERGSWKRALLLGSSSREVKGLVELMDNNPLVCADEASVPSALGTLALVALGPLARAGLILEGPVIKATQDGDDIDDWLATEGWTGGCVFEVEPVDLGTVVAMTALAVVPTPEDPLELDGLYDEAYSRSFYVRRDEESEWDTRLVAGRPWACYRLAMTPDEPTCLVRIQVMADRDGKLGAAQMVHAMNVMSGFEESLGIPDELPR